MTAEEWLSVAAALYLIQAALTGVLLLSWRWHVRHPSSADDGDELGLRQVLLLAIMWPLTWIALLRQG